MTGRRLAAALLAVVAASCTAVLGLTGQTNTVDFVCTTCQGQFGITWSRDDCATFMNRRLDALGDAERDAWLKNFVKECGTCDELKSCFYWKGICTEGGFACVQNGECCSSQDGGGCDAGLCE